MQLSDLITYVRQRADVENNQFVTDTELTLYINNSLAELDDIMVTDYEDYRLSNYFSNLPSDGLTNIIPIPPDFYKLRGVDYKAAANAGGISNDYYTLQAFQFPERNRDNNTISNMFTPYGKTKLTYRLADQGIMIQPQSEAGGAYQIWYTPRFNPLINLTDIIPIVMATNAWVEYAVVDCCIKIYNKQQLDSSMFTMEKASLKERIRSAAKNRDSSGPKRVANTRYQCDSFNLGYGFDVLY